MQIPTILFHSYVSVYIFKYIYISVYIFQYVSIKELTKICNHKMISILATKSATFNHFLFLNIIYLFLAMLGLHCCIGFSLVEVSRGFSSVAVWRLLLLGAQALGRRGFSSCGT